MVLKENSLALRRPDLVKLLVDKDDAVLTCGSHRKVRWWCDNGEGHWFECAVNNRVNGSCCSYCSGKKVLHGFNDLSTVRPDIAKYFNAGETRRQAERHPEKKWATTPEKVTVGSTLWAVWDCENGLEHWCVAMVVERSKGGGCGVCHGFQVIPGFNDFSSKYPNIAQYFNAEETRRQAEKYPEKKWVITLEDATVGSGKYAVWNCENGEQHWYDMQLSLKSKKYGCPICAGHRVLPGFNDLVSLRPDVAALWDYQGNTEKNKESTSHPKTPKEVTVSSNRACSWLCSECGGVFSRAVCDMTRESSSQRCFSCTESQGERELAEFIADLLPRDMNLLRNNRTVLKPNELDVYIPELSLAFEFNGDYWHSDDVIREKKGVSAEEWHGWKLTECANQGIDLFFVWESDWNDSRKRATIEKYIQEIVALRLEGKKLTKTYRLLTILSKG